MTLLWDILAGLSVAGLLLPEAVAYSLIAGVAPAHAIVAALCGLLVYGALGRSRFAIVAPTSSSAAILAASVGSLAIADPAMRLQIMAGLVLLAGLTFIAFGLARLGNLSSFVSRPVLHGFAFGLSITITIKQLPLILGLEKLGGSALQVGWALFEHFSEWNMASLVVGASGLAALLLLKHIRGVPAAFLVLLGGIAISHILNLGTYHVKLLGLIGLSGFHPALPDLDRADWLRLLELAPPLFLIIFAESWGAIRNLSLLHNEQVDANRELISLGAANVVSSLFQGLAVGAGFSASSANEAAGAQSRLAGVFSALTVLAMMMFALPLLALLPEPILAAVVIAALSHALNPAPLLRLWTIRRDYTIAAAAAALVLIFGVLIGMLGAIALSILALVSRLSSANVAVLGELGLGHDFVDVARFPEARVTPDIMVVRPAHPLFFANAEGVFAQILALIAPTSSRALIINLEESADLDSTALDSLGEFKSQLDHQGIALSFARVRLKVSQALSLCEDAQLADPARQSQSVADAFAAARAALTPRE